MFLRLNIIWGLLTISDLISISEEQEKIIYGCDNDLMKNFSTSVNMLQLANENFRFRLESIDNKLSEDLMSEFKQKLNQITENVIKETVLKIEESLKFQKLGTHHEKLLKKSNGNIPFGLCDKSSTNIPESCAEALANHPNCSDGIYLLNVPNFNLEPFYAYCMRDPRNSKTPAWTVVQRRKDRRTSFNKSWEDYKNGFGDLNNSFWLGLNRLHAITATQHHELWIAMEDNEGEKRNAMYGNFVIGSEQLKFPLSILSEYSGNVADALTGHIGQKFTTIDADNDDRVNSNCATDFSGGWWFQNCHVSNLNGEYGNSDYGKGIIWKGFHGYDYSLKYAHMAIRPKFP